MCVSLQFHCRIYSDSTNHHTSNAACGVPGVCVVGDSPMQLPFVPWEKPVGQRGLGLHRNEPSVFTHSKLRPQVWVLSAHSSISGERERERQRERDRERDAFMELQYYKRGL